MARTHGTKNQDYEEKRTALLIRLQSHLVAAKPLSFREMAAAALVSVPTLRHYFGNRDGVIAAFLVWKGQMGQPHLVLASRADGDFSASIHSLIAYAIYGLKNERVIDLHVVGLTEGLAQKPLGTAYLQSILEPSLAAIETRLAAHIAHNQMRKVDVRVAALALVTPVIFAVLHQTELGGDALRHLDLDQFAKAHVDAFVRAYASESTQPTI